MRPPGGYLKRSFLLQTSILDRLEGSLCDAVTGSDGGKSMLEALDRSNLFVIPLDDRRRWYRYHHLFADVLQARLRDEQPNGVLELHRRASGWHEQQGDRPEAIRHALAGYDFERAAELVELAVPAMRQARREATMRDWFEALPADLFPTRPVLSIGYVGAIMASGDSAGVEQLLHDVDRCLDPAVVGEVAPGDGEPGDGAVDSRALVSRLATAGRGRRDHRPSRRGFRRRRRGRARRW